MEEELDTSESRRRPDPMWAAGRFISYHLWKLVHSGMSRTPMGPIQIQKAVSAPHNRYGESRTFETATVETSALSHVCHAI